MRKQRSFAPWDPFSKKKSRSACADRDFFNQIKSPQLSESPLRKNQCYFICIIFFVAEAVAVSNV
jgi:hypothetical protein